MSNRLMRGAVALAASALFAPALQATPENAKRWIDNEFQPSVLTKAEQQKEMEWFIKAAKPFKGMEINVLSETIPTHEYESKTLTKAFVEITGIKVNHQLLGEGEVVQAVQTQMQTNRNLYDAYINDSRPDRHALAPAVGGEPHRLDGRRGQGRHRCRRSTSRTSSASRSPPVPTARSTSCPTSSSPTCTGSATTGSSAPDLKKKFKDKYGYELGVPVNWSAYEDIAEFFSVRRQGDRRRAHLRPHGLRQARARPGLAHDRRLAVDGRRGQQGPAQRPADRRVGHPHGGRLLQSRRAPPCRAAARPTDRPRSTRSPSGTSGCASTRRRAPPTTTSTSRCRRCAQGNVAQQIFWYTAFTASMVAPKKDGNNTVDDEGKPLWRMAPSPHGPYWEEGMKLGYQDAGSWTLFKSHAGRPAQGGLAVRAVRGLQDRRR